MKQAIILICLLLVTGCEDSEPSLEYVESIFEEMQDNKPKEPSMSIEFKTLECPEGCILKFGTVFNVSKEDYPENYTLPYDLARKIDNCGLDALIYFNQTGRYITHIYDKDNNLLGAFESYDECPYEVKTYGNSTYECGEIIEEVIFEVIREPEKYISYGDCK